MATPPFFHAADPVAIDQWLSHGMRMPLHGDQPITPYERDLLEAWRELSAERDIFDLADLHEALNRLTAKPRALNSISRLTSQTCIRLAEAGIIWRERATELGSAMGRCLIYTLRAPSEVAASWKGDASTSQDNPAAKRKRSTPVAETPSESAQRTHEHLKALGWFDFRGAPQATPKTDGVDDAWTLHLISQLIERCSRSNCREKIETLSSHIWMGGEMIEVEAARVHHRWEESAEYGLITAEDSQLILAIITMAVKGIARDLYAGIRPPRNRVSFDLLELSKMLHPTGGRSAYQTFQRGMARIINTSYRLSRVGEQGKQRMTFRLIENVMEGEGNPTDCDDTLWSPQDAGMRYFSFSLNAHIWKGLLSRQGWLVHPELLFERSGLIHRVYHHLRTHARTDKTYRIEAEDLAKWLVSGQGTNPRRSRMRFREELREQLQQRAQRAQFTFGIPSFGDEAPQGELRFRLFDLDLKLCPNGSEAGSYALEARQSEETLALLRRQDVLNSEIEQRAGEDGWPALPGSVR